LGAGYAFITAYLKGEEAKIVTSEHIGSLTRTTGISDVLDVIRDTDVGGYLDGLDIQNFDELDEQLWTYFGECLRRLEWFKGLPSDIRKLLNAYIVKYDVLNIKAVLQGISTGSKPEPIPVGIIHRQELLETLFGAEDVDGIREVLSGCGLEEYASALAEYNVEEGTRSRLSVEAGLDEIYYRDLMNATRRMKDGGTLTRVFGVIADMVNLQIVMRSVIKETGAEVAEYAIDGGYLISEQTAKDLAAMKPGDLPAAMDNAEYRGMVEEIISNYERTRSLAVVEEIIDKNKLRLLGDILAPRVMSPLVAVWYLVMKEIELRNLRMVMKAAFDGISIEEIRDYLVV
jgi:V/A-type H+-transporting ATPase subunit C